MLIRLCTSSYTIASHFSRPFLPFVMPTLKSKACLQSARTSSWLRTSYPLLQLLHCRKYWCALDLGQTSGPSFDTLFWLDTKPLIIISWKWVFNNSGSNFPVALRMCYYNLLLKMSGEIQGENPYYAHVIQHLTLFSFPSGFWHCLRRK